MFSGDPGSPKSATHQMVNEFLTTVRASNKMRLQIRCVLSETKKLNLLESAIRSISTNILEVITENRGVDVICTRSKKVFGNLIYIQQDATLHSLFYLETALHVSGGTTTHHQERKQLYLQHLVFVTPLPLSAAIVEELKLDCVFCGWRSTTYGACAEITTHSTHQTYRVTYTRCRIDTINSPDDGHMAARNM
jgi:hypothetical protein